MTHAPGDILTPSGDSSRMRTLGKVGRSIGSMTAAEPPFGRVSRSRESRSRLLARVAFEAVWERDLRTDALSWDGNLESMFGYDRSEAENYIGWWRERVHPEDLDRLEQVLSEAIRSGAPGWSNEYRFRRKDGSWAWV